MPGVDWLPGVSHLKALVQVATGDTEGASRTMENFHRECPVVSQVTSLVQLAAGDADGALETQKRCLGTVNNVANGIPVVGHIKGVVHHAVGDHKGGNQALNAATRSTVVIASGAAAGIATGGIGAIPAGIAAGVGYDVTATEITGEDQGYVAAIKNAVENPSAGAIFDAACIPVGDGLAGYSGGQIANKVASQVQLNSLEAARSAKMDQLNNAILDQSAGGGGGGGGMTSGQAMSLGKEINALTSEINAIQHGTPQYWVDAKTGEVVSGAPPSNVPVAVPGYVDENDPNNKEDIAPKIIPKQEDAQNSKETGDQDNKTRQQDVASKTIPKQEDAVEFDSYVDAVVTKDNKQGKKNALKKHDNQKASNNINEVYPNVQNTTITKLAELLRKLLQAKDPNRDPNRNPRELGNIMRDLLAWSWLPLEMPAEFSYTGVIQTNSVVQGLLHSFIRHMDQWMEYVDIDQQLLDRIGPLRAEIVCVLTADENTLEDARNMFLEARRQLKINNPEAYRDVQAALVEIQMKLHAFIQKNITYMNYRGREVNSNGHVSLQFEVITKDGKKKVMVIALSENLFKSSPRDIRIVITVFFVDLKTADRRLAQTKEEEEKEKKK